MTGITTTPQGPRIETVITVPAGTFTCHEYPLQVARVRSVRRALPEGFHDPRGRFVGRVG